jgi:hypothetical protein
MIDPAVLMGLPLNFNKRVKIYPPKIKDVIGNINYSRFFKILTISHEDISYEYHKKNKDTKNIPTPFEFLFINCYHDQNFKRITEEAFEFFTRLKPIFLYEEKIIVLGDLDMIIQNIKSTEGIITITEDDYFTFQNLIRVACGDKELPPPEPPNPNEDPRITEMKRKARERDRIKAKQSSKSGISLQVCLVAICCMGIGITPLNIGEMSYAAIGPLMKMS